MKRTPWFNGDEFPIREGVYERNLYKYGNHRVVYSYWDGDQWYVGTYSASDAKAMADRHGPTLMQDRSWRGLMKEDDDEP